MLAIECVFVNMASRATQVKKSIIWRWNTWSLDLKPKIRCEVVVLGEHDISLRSLLEPPSAVP